MKIIKRHIEKTVLELFQTFPCVYIKGPRQAGKTTFVRTIPEKKLKAKFITFDDTLEKLAAKRNPKNYLRESGTPLIIDEVQMAPEIFRPLKLLIDEQRFENLQNDLRTFGKYLLTGSANFMLIPQLADAMVGRMATINLYPLSVSEVIGNKSSFIERLFTKDFSEIKSNKTSLTETINLATYPDLINQDQEYKNSWFSNYINKVTLEDPKQIYNLEKAEYMPLLLQKLALRVGNLINDSDISRDIGLNVVTNRTYRKLLTGTFITYELQPWYRNIGKRLVKAGKIYFYDTLLLNHLLNNAGFQNPNIFGHLLENFVFMELLKDKNNNNHHQTNLFFYRTRDGKEVDFVLERQNQIIGIEVKNSETITDKDISGLKELQQVTGKDFLCGIILCNTDRVINFDKNIYLVPINTLWS